MKNKGITPEKLKNILEGAEELIHSLHLSALRVLIRRIAIRLRKGKEDLAGGADKNLVETLTESGKLREDIEKDLAKATKVTEQEIHDAFEKVGTASVAVPPEVYEQVGIPKEASQSGLSPAVVRVMERNYDVTMGAMKNLSRTRADAINRVFIEETDKALVEMQTNNMSLTEAFYNACANINANGITTVAYTNNGKVRSEKVEVAVLRALRTAMSQTSAQIVLKRAEELGIDLIKVSSHIGARTTKVAGKPYADHSSWQGKIYSLSGADNRYPSFYDVTGFGTGEGLAGYNCRHTINVAIDGYTKEDEIDEEENAKRYELEQKQRRLERAIRKSKESYAIWEQAYKEFPEDEKIKERYEAELAHLKAKIDEYYEFCKDNNLRPLEERLKISNV